MLSSTLKFEKVLFSFRASARVAGPRRPSKEAKHKQSHEAQSDSIGCYVAHARRESGMDDREVFPPFNRFSILLATQSMHISSFLVAPSFVNLGMRFLLREESCNTACYDSSNYLLITLIRSLIMHQVHWLIKF
jgi:hypothetical protein